MILYLILTLSLILFLKHREHFPFYHMTPPKRNVSYDLRCDPYIPKKNLGPWRHSTIDYYHRPKCLVQL